MSCDPPAPTVDLDNVPRLVPPPVGRTTLVSRSSAAHVHTGNRECDAETAVRRGLKEYLEQVSIDVGGQTIRFNQVFDVWADTDDVATYPAAVITTGGETEWDGSNFTPVINEKFRTPDGQYLIKYHEVVFTMTLETHSSSPEERVAIAMLLEDALNPVTWMSGFKLDLPHYFNQRVVYTPISTRFTDSADLAVRRNRPGALQIQAQISLVRPRKLPTMEARVQVEVGTDVTVTATNGVESL